jgi:arylsulfatase A-like enzyme
MAQVDLQQKKLFRRSAKPSRLLRKAVLQQNKPAGPPGRVALMQMNDVLHQKNSSGLREGYAEDYQRSVVTDRYKLVYVPDAEDRKAMKGSPLELYDLQRDPGETQNLAAERPEVVAPLRKRLWDWMEDGGEAEVAPAAVPIDEGTERQLRSLGYIE